MCVRMVDVDNVVLLISPSMIQFKRCCCPCSVVATAPDILTPLALVLESVLQADQQLMERTKAKVFSALISVLQIQGLNGERPASA